MTTFQSGDSVIVEFDGLEHPGEIISHRHGFIEAVIVIDPAADYGRGTSLLAPHQIVCVRECRVRPAI